MKRLTVEGNWRRRASSAVEWILRDDDGATIAVVYDTARPTVEDIGDPPPTSTTTIANNTPEA